MVIVLKFNLIIVLLVFGVMCGGCLSSTNDVTGTYISEDGSVLELKSDGRYTVTQKNSFAGEYTYNEQIVTLIYSFGSFKATRDGVDLIDNDGDRWTKQ